MDELAIDPPWVGDVAYDLPGGEWRRVQRAKGYDHILVNGDVTIESGDGNGATHVIGGWRMLKTALDGGSTEEVGKAMEAKVGNAFLAEWKAASGGAASAINADSLSKTANLPFGAMPGEMAVGVFTNDVLIHTWDLARATGGDEKLDQEALRAGYEAMKPMDAMIRQPGVFGPKIEAPPGADLQTE